MEKIRFLVELIKNNKFFKVGFYFLLFLLTIYFFSAEVECSWCFQDFKVYRHIFFSNTSASEFFLSLSDARSTTVYESPSDFIDNCRGMDLVLLLKGVNVYHICYVFTEFNFLTKRLPIVIDLIEIDNDKLVVIKSSDFENNFQKQAANHLLFLNLAQDKIYVKELVEIMEISRISTRPAIRLRWLSAVLKND